MIFFRKKKLLLIVNPRAGRMQGVKVVGEIVRLFCERGFDVTVHTTTATSDATETASAARDYRQIVCCGGDGTLNEVVSGVLDGGHGTPIGYIPCGTTNDLARSLGLPKTIMAAAQAIVNGKPTEQDVGLFDGRRYFTYVASFGAFTKASYATPQNVKNTFGHIAYLAEGLKSIGDIKPIRLKAEYNGLSVTGDYIFGAVTNSTSVGGVMQLRKDAVDLRDGLFEVMLVRAPANAADVAVMLNEVLSQKYSGNAVLFAHTSQITFTSEQPLDWTIDGESGGETRQVCIKNLHGAVKLILPSKKRNSI